jgi:molecular chaperone HtpG
VFLREMIQNAHDSIKRRAEFARERGEAELPAPRIQVAVNREARTIEVHDNGSGLTPTEIDDYLSTIGRSGTDELRQRIREADRGRAVDLIGQFGIGLLSAFIVAERVTLVTRAPGHRGLRWQSRGGQRYTVDSVERTLVGTTVTLHIAPAHQRYLDRNRLRTIIRTYADFISVPVYLDDDAEPANAVTAPWHRRYVSERERRAAYTDFWERKFTRESSLYVFAVDEPVEWDDITQPDGKGHGRVRGVLAVTDRRSDLNARGVVDLYIQRMFINAGNREVLPPWAKFVQGVVECNELTPNAARDNVVRNAALAAVQQALGWLVVRELTELSGRNHPRFVEIMRWHSYDVLAMSVQDEYEDFFRAVADLVPLESDPEPITVAEYLKTAPVRTDGSRVVSYITEPGSANQYFLLAGARSMRVFNCAEPYAERFLQRYAETWPDRVHLSRLDVAGSETIFEPLAVDEQERFAELQAVYNVLFPELRVLPRVSSFRPVLVPAVLTETRDSKTRREMEDVTHDLALPGFIRDLVKDYLNTEREPLTLHLNADNPTIQQLADRHDLRDEVSRHALVALYNNALMLLARTLRVQDVQAMFGQYNQVIELMLALDAERADLQRTLNARRGEIDELRAPPGDRDSGLDPYVSCFVAMSFGDPRAAEIYEAVRTVLEARPYYCAVVRADDTVEQPGLWANLKAKLLRAHCYVAILTQSHNPNVMIEVGRMEALERPVVLLRDAAAADLPADLKGRLYAQLTATGEALTQEVRDAFARQEPFHALIGDRYLSQSVLRQEANLNDQVSRDISRLYRTWSAFLQADPHEIARRVNVRPRLIEAAQEALTDADE